MNPLKPSLLLALVLAPPSPLAERGPEDTVQVVVLGTFHMDAAGDALNPVLEDVLGETRQRELDEFVQHLAAFNPTKVALEALPNSMPSLGRDYEAYRRGELEPRKDERYQVGFRLAASLGHARVYGVDHDLPIDPLEGLSWAQAHGQADMAQPILVGYQSITASWASAMAQGSLLDVYRAFNSRKTDEALHELFMSFLRIGSDVEPVGATMLGRWHERNLHIAANVVRLSDPDDRILVLIGANHRKLLIEFLSRMPGVDVLEATSFLGESENDD